MYKAFHAFHTGSLPLRNEIPHQHRRNRAICGPLLRDIFLTPTRCRLFRCQPEPSSIYPARRYRLNSGAGGDIGEAHQSVHQRQLPRVIELEARDALSVGQGGGRSQFLELAAIDESFQDVLLGIVVVVNDLGHALAQLRQVLDVLFDPIVGDVIGGRLGS